MTEADNTGRMRRAALGLAARGLLVFPCRPRGKAPLTARGCLDATTEAGRIDSWWAVWPNANLAVATGAASGVFVIDVDDDEGEASLRRLEDEHGALPATVEVITGRGRHLYFRVPGKGQIRNSAGKLGEGLDVRGEHGYVMVPPSIHPSGRPYRWSVDTAGTFADPPAWLVESLVSTSKEGTPTPPGEWRALVRAGVGQGQRNATAARLAGLLFRRLDPLVAVELITCWNEVRCRPPLSQAELKRTLDSIAARELRRIGGGS